MQAHIRRHCDPCQQILRAKHLLKKSCEKRRILPQEVNRLDQELERQASENLMLAERVKQMQQRLQVPDLLFEQQRYVMKY